MISIVIPTISVRSHWLERCMEAYERTSAGAEHELIVVRDHPTWGSACNEGLPQARGDYVHLTADDVEPLDGWWQAAIAVCDAGMLPAPLILNSDGSLQSCGGASIQPEGSVAEFTRIPFASREQIDAIGPLPPIHYYADNFFSLRGRRLAYQTVVAHGYSFIHHFAPEGRVDGRLYADAKAYAELV